MKIKQPFMLLKTSLKTLYCFNINQQLNTCHLSSTTYKIPKYFLSTIKHFYLLLKVHLHEASFLAASREELADSRLSRVNTNASGITSAFIVSSMISS